MYSKPRQGDAKELAVAALAVIGAILAHLFTYWNRFLGVPVTGMFYEFAVLLRRGLVPYRDFYIVVPPLYVFKTAVMIALFGPGILPERLVEVITRCVIAVVLLVWLRRVTTISNALVGTIAGAIMFCTDLADPLTSYHHESVFWAVIGGFLLSFLGGQLDWLLIAGSGVCSALSLTAAQPVGVATSLSLLVIVSILGFWAARTRGLVKYMLLYAAGWAIPSGALLLWLGHAGAATAFLRTIFVTGLSSKGSIFSILLRFLGGPFSFHITGLDDIIALTCAIGLIALLVRRKDPASEDEPSAIRWSYIGLCFGGIAAGALFAELSAYPHAWWRLAEVENIVLRAGLFCSIALAGYYTFRALRIPPSNSEKQRWLLSVVAFATSYALSMSWPAYGIMAFPSLAVVIAFGMDELRGRSFGTQAQYALVGAVSVLLLIAEYQRAMMPFNWIGWIDSPVRRATTTIPLAPLRGIYVDPETKKFTLDLTRLIEEHARPGEPVFIFPYQALFYTLADRWPPTFAQVHYFDVTPDEICREDARRLVNAKPAVIVDFAASPELFQSMENQWRHGKRSGQRDLYEAMYRLIKQDYHLASVMHQPGSATEVRVFVRNGR